MSIIDICTASDASSQNFVKRWNEHAENASEMSDKEGTAVDTELRMPSVSVVTRLVVLMTWRKFIRNPNIHASIFGLAWSLLSIKYCLSLSKSEFVAAFGVFAFKTLIIWKI